MPPRMGTITSLRVNAIWPGFSDWRRNRRKPAIINTRGAKISPFFKLLHPSHSRSVPGSPVEPLLPPDPSSAPWYPRALRQVPVPTEILGGGDLAHHAASILPIPLENPHPALP